MTRTTTTWRAAGRGWAILAGATLAGLIATAGSGWAADSLTVTEYGVAATSLPWGVARDQNLFKKNGLAFDGIIGSNGGGTAIRNMMASGLPFGEIATSAAIAAVQTGLDVEFVYSANNNAGDMAWMVQPGSPVKTLADLKGRTAGYSNPHSTTEMFLRITLHSAGLDKEVKTIPTGGIAGGLTMVAQGVIDSASADEPAFLPEGKFRRLFYVRDHIPNITWTVGITTRSYAKAHPDMVAKLVLARKEAVDFMYAHPDEAAKTYAKDWQIAPDLANQILKRLLATNYFSRGDFNMPALKTALEGLQMMGTLKEPVDLAKLIDTQFLPKDLR
jgi:NitT/TauT family transport system substrate-binding protein